MNGTSGLNMEVRAGAAASLLGNAAGERLVQALVHDLGPLIQFRLVALPLGR